MPKGSTAGTLNATYNNLDSVRALFKANPGEIAGIMLEPVVGNSGYIEPTQEFLEGLRTICTEVRTRSACFYRSAACVTVFPHRSNALVALCGSCAAPLCRMRRMHSMLQQCLGGLVWGLCGLDALGRWSAVHCSTLVSRDPLVVQLVPYS